jgi:long-chain acyl-CoA synthetase
MLYTALQQIIQASPHKTALFCETEPWTYLQLDHHIKTYQGLLQSYPPETRIALLLYNQVEFIAAFFAGVSLGLTIVPLSYRLSEAEQAVILEDASVSLLITSDLLLEKTSFATVVTIETLTPNPLNIKLDSPNEKALAVLIYTSGTTGTPKGVMLSHGNLLADTQSNQSVIEALPEDVFITVSPLFHVFGLINVMLTALLHGASLVVIRRFHPKLVLEAIEKHHVTVLAAVPTMYTMILAVLETNHFNLTSLRVCHSGASPLSPSLFQKIESAFSAPVQEGYGQSEASSIVTSNPLYGTRKPGSIGLAIPNVRVEVVDQSGERVSVGAVGEIRVFGATVMQGYWNNTEKTAQVLREGWLYTGDLATLDDEGYLFLIGRQDDLMNIAGQKVYPIEVENVLLKHPEVVECAVKSFHSDLYGQLIGAFVVLRENSGCQEQDLQKHCYLFLADYKVPKMVTFLSTLPKTASGKILRQHLALSGSFDPISEMRSPTS